MSADRELHAETTINASPDAVWAALRPNTRWVWLETPTNPRLKVADLRAIAQAAHDHNPAVRVVVDNTFATPYLQQPLALGADVVVHSTTKYLGGHSDVVGGAVLTSDAKLHERLAFLQNAVRVLQTELNRLLAEVASLRRENSRLKGQSAKQAQLRLAELEARVQSLQSIRPANDVVALGLKITPRSRPTGRAAARRSPSLDASGRA